MVNVTTRTLEILQTNLAEHKIIIGIVCSCFLFCFVLLRLLPTKKKEDIGNKDNFAPSTVSFVQQEDDVMLHGWQKRSLKQKKAYTTNQTPHIISSRNPIQNSTSTLSVPVGYFKLDPTQDTVASLFMD